MVRGATDRLELDMTPVVNFLSDKVATYPSMLAKEFGVPVPLATTNQSLVSFQDENCVAKGHLRSSLLMNNVKPIFVIDESTLAILRIDLDKAEFVAVMHHEPPKSLPYADRWDLLTIRTMDHAFHILPLTDSTIARHAVNVFQSFKGLVYARSPQGLHRILQEEYAWAPTFCDITQSLDAIINKSVPESQWRQSSFSDICNTLFGCPPCWKGRVFSCHARPSRCALRHIEHFVSLVYVFARRHIGAHVRMEGDVGAAAGSPAVEEERRVEEERLQREEEDRLRFEEEQRVEEERLRVLQEFEEEEKRHHEAGELLRKRRREFEHDGSREDVRSRKRSRSRSPDRRRSSGRSSGRSLDNAVSAEDSSRRRRL